jgi:hypothetical protein
MTEGGSTDGLEETFGLVANDIRLDILRTLWDLYTDDPAPEPEPVQFSTLRERVGVRDPGQFHYHLDELVPRLVSHHEEGYTLTSAGAQVVAAGVSGRYTDTDASLDPQPVEECSNCDGTLELRYEQGHAVADCDGCEATRIMSAPPILVVAHDVEENPELLGTFTLAKLQQTVRGFCQLCSGPVEARVPDSSLDGQVEPLEGVKVVYECTECRAPFYVTATMAVLDHPAVVALLHDGGIDYREVPSWGVTSALDSKERILDDDPVRVEVTVDEELTLVLDENLEVLEYSRA